MGGPGKPAHLLALACRQRRWRRAKADFLDPRKMGKGKKIDWAKRLVTRVVVGTIRGWHGWDGAWMPYVSTRRLESFGARVWTVLLRTVDTGGAR